MENSPRKTFLNSYTGSRIKMSSGANYILHYIYIYIFSGNKTSSNIGNTIYETSRIWCLPIAVNIGRIKWPTWLPLWFLMETNVFLSGLWKCEDICLCLMLGRKQFWSIHNFFALTPKTFRKANPCIYQGRKRKKVIVSVQQMGKTSEKWVKDWSLPWSLEIATYALVQNFSL